MSDFVIDRSERLDLTMPPREPANAHEARFVRSAERLIAVTLVADRKVDPLLVRAYRGERLVAWTVRDQFGWAIMARVPVWTIEAPVAERETWVKTVDRYEPFPGEASITVRVAALTGLARYATTGRTDVP